MQDDQSQALSLTHDWKITHLKTAVAATAIIESNLKQRRQLQKTYETAGYRSQVNIDFNADYSTQIE